MSTDVVALTERLVGVDSQNPGTGESALADVITAEIAEPAGIDVERLEFAPDRTNLVLTVDKGPGPHLAMAGHLDTKPIGDSLAEWESDPMQLSIRGGLAYGLGTSDMKGPIAAMLVALQNFAHTPGSGRASVLLTADEETSSAAGARPLAARGLPNCDAMVIGEPSGVTHPWEMIAAISRGICCFQIEVRTRQGHSGLSPILGRSAVQLAAEIVLALDDYSPPIASPGPVPSTPTVNPGIFVEGGIAYGTWPGRCVLGCEIRLVPGMHRDDVMDSVRQLVDGIVQGRGEATIHPLQDGRGWAAAVTVDPHEPVIVAAQRACTDILGRTPPLTAYPGTTEATHFLPGLGIPVIASLGPGWLTVAHGPNECVGVEDLHAAARIYQRLCDYFVAPPESTIASSATNGDL